MLIITESDPVYVGGHATLLRAKAVYTLAKVFNILDEKKYIIFIFRLIRVF